MPRASILVVDDEQIVAADICNKLTGAGFTVAGVAASGQQAVELAEQTKPDLALMDIVMPGDMDGVEAARRLRAKLGIPVIYMGSNSDDSVLGRAKDTEPLGYILKPYADRQLITTIEVALHQYTVARERSQEQLQLSQEPHRLLVEAARDYAIYMLDAHGNVTTWNAGAERLTGYAASEVIGRPFSLLYPEADVQSGAPRRTLSGAALHGQATDEGWRVRKDGSRFWARATTTALSGAGGTLRGFARITRDLTDPRRAEDAIRESEERYRLLFNTMLNGFGLHEIICDQEGKPCDYRFLEVNPAFEAMTGLKAAEILGRTALEVMPDTEPAWIQQYGEVALTGKPARFEGYARALKKHFGVNAFSVRAGEFAAVVEDITARKRAERLQDVLRGISHASVSAADLQEMYRTVHSLVGELMPLENFYIAIYDPASNDLSFPYFVDQYDQVSSPQKLGRGLTEYVLRTGRPLLAPPAVFEQLVREGEVELVGMDSIDWLGVPLKVDGRTIGVMVAQSYTESIRFGETELELMEFVSSQVAQSIERKKAVEQLRTSEARFASAFENAAIGMALVAPDGRWLKVNQALCDVVGYSAAELLAKRFEEITHPDDLDTDLDYHRRLLTDELQTYQLEKRYFHKQGQTIWVLLSVSLVRDDRGQPLYFISQVQDITARKQAETQIQRQLERLAALRTIDSAISGSLDLRLTLNVALEQTLSQLKVDAACVLLLDPTTQTLRFAAGRGFRTAALQDLTFRLGEGYAGTAALERRTVRVSGISRRETDFLRSPGFKSEQFDHYTGVPLMAKGKVLGVLEVFQRNATPPADDWTGFLDILAGQAAIAVDNATLFSNLQRSNDDLTLAYDATIEGWSRALDLRDQETEGHTRRVADMTIRLARLFGIPDEQLIHMRRGALLHDIGKMAIPDTVLHKPGPLDDEEWKLMKQHPTFARDMLAPIRYLQPALDIPWCHHEHWDGNGYPRGLKGEQIPLAARIFAVVDVWDALTSARPYRPAWLETPAAEHIRKLSGSHFDPDVVRVFLQERDAQRAGGAEAQ